MLQITPESVISRGHLADYRWWSANEAPRINPLHTGMAGLQEAE
jgi:hypothetical protein